MLLEPGFVDPDLVERTGPRQRFAAVATLLLALVVTVFLCASHVFAVHKLRVLWTSYEDYAINIAQFSPVVAKLEDLTYFTTQADMRATRHVSISYRYMAQGRVRWSSCISFQNCAALEPEDFSGLLDRDIRQLKPGDPINIHVSGADPSQAYLFLESGAAARRLLYVPSVFWGVIIFLGMLVQWMALNAAIKAWNAVRSVNP